MFSFTKRYLTPIIFSSLVVCSFNVSAEKVCLDLVNCYEDSVLQQYNYSGCSPEELRISIILATQDFAAKSCSYKPNEPYDLYRSEMLENPKIRENYQKYSEYINSICIYSMENWCKDYARPNSIFLLH